MNNRRRLLSVVALSGGLALTPRIVLAKDEKAKVYQWNGIALGADASIQLYAASAHEAEKILNNATHIIQKYERLFSLYDQNSETSRLNNNGYLESPSGDFVKLTQIAGKFGQETNGAFDITIQPLWDLYKNQFNTESGGELNAKIDRLLPIIGYKNINVAEDYISFAKEGMAVSFNGIAQGFITDKVTEYLKSEGYKNVLVDIGEYNAAGPQADGQPWRIGLLNPFDAVSIADVIEIKNGAIATSGGYGNQFDQSGNHHHLFNPKTGQSSNLYASVTVKANDATTADALSTAFSNMQLSEIEHIVKTRGGIEARLTANDGNIYKITS